MTDWVTISQVATAGGTMILAVATFASIRSSQHSARVAERAMLAAQRPLLIPSRDDDPIERVAFIDSVRVDVPGHGGVVHFENGHYYLALSVRNGGSGMAVLRGWRVRVFQTADAGQPDPDDFRRQTLDMFIPAGFSGFWQGAVRDESDPQYTVIRDAFAEHARIIVDILYGDQEGGQRAIARFTVATTPETETDARARVVRYWNVDGVDPRA